MRSYISNIVSRLNRVELKTIIRNSIWLFADKFLRILSGIFVGTLVARHFGPDQYGVYSYVISLVSLVSVISTLGLEQIVIKELVVYPDRKKVVLGTAFVLRFIGAIILVGVSLKLVSILNTGNYLITSLTAIISTSYIFQAFNVLDEWFQSQVQSRYVVISRDIALILGLLAKLYIINSNKSVITLGYVIAAEIIISSIIMIIFFTRNKQRILEWRFHKNIVIDLLRQSWPLITSSVMVSIYMKIDQIMIVNLNSSSQGGQYAAAVQLSEALYFIPTVITSSVYPHLLKIINDNNFYIKRNNQLFLVLSLISYSICLPVAIFSGSITKLLFGSLYPDTGIILAFHIWSLLFVSMGVGQSPWVISKELTKIAMIWSFIGALVNISLNILVLPKYGGVGAAIATLISYSLSGFLLNYFSIKTRPIFWAQLRALLLLDIIKESKYYFYNKH